MLNLLWHIGCHFNSCNCDFQLINFSSMLKHFRGIKTSFKVRTQAPLAFREGPLQLPQTPLREMFKMELKYSEVGWEGSSVGVVRSFCSFHWEQGDKESFPVDARLKRFSALFLFSSSLESHFPFQNSESRAALRIMCIFCVGGW